MLMGTPAIVHNWSIILLLACCVLHVAVALDAGNLTQLNAEDYRHRQRVVGGEAETNEIVVQWQVLFMKNGSFAAPTGRACACPSCRRF